MGFLDKLKNLKNKLFGNKIKALPPAKDNKINIPDTLEQYKVPYNVAPGSIEYAIDQYLSALLYNRQHNEAINSYGALTSLGGLQDIKRPGNNFANESKVLNKIHNSPELYMQTQRSKNGDPCFYHISKGNYGEIKNRLYLNCRRENVASIANELLTELKDTKSFYFKFDADAQMQNHNRPEKFVFYLSDDPNEVNNVVQAIENIKQRKPVLFQNSNEVMPFMKTFNGNIMYAKEPKTNVYIGLDGKPRNVAKSYNSFLAEALNDSYLNTIQDIVAKDYNLSQKVSGKIFDDSMTYTFLALEDIMNDPNKEKSLVEGMRDKLKICMQKNPVLDIKGIDQNDKTKSNVDRSFPEDK